MSQRVGRLSGTLYSGPFLHGHSGMVRKHQTSDAQLRIGESRDSGFDAGAGHWARTRVVRLEMPAWIRGYLLLLMRACQTMIIMSQRRRHGLARFLQLQSFSRD
jgi:hypothetical protein